MKETVYMRRAVLIGLMTIAFMVGLILGGVLIG